MSRRKSTPKKPARRKGPVIMPPEKRRTTKQAKAAFLEAFGRLGVVEIACRSANVGRRTVYQWRDKDDAFAASFYEAADQSTELLEAEALRRAAHGTTKPVYQGGRHVGDIREYSDTLLIFMLKARRPHVYRDRVDVKHDGEITHRYANLSDTELDAQISQLLAQVSEGEVGGAAGRAEAANPTPDEPDTAQLGALGTVAP